MLSYILPFIVVLTIIVFFHELGHFAVARRCGVRVEVFSIGFGPELVGFTARSGTRWRLSAIPLGGYVRMFGDQKSPEIEKNPQLMECAFFTRSLGQRAAIVAAGPIANFLLALVLLCPLFFFFGKPTPAERIIIDAVTPESPAEKSGLQPGDVLVSVNGQILGAFSELLESVQQSNGDILRIAAERDGTLFQVQARPEPITREDGSESFQLGVRRKALIYEKLGIVGSLAAGGGTVWLITSETLKALGGLFVGSTPAEAIGGPIRIVQYSHDFAVLGAFSFVFFVAALSVNLGLINLFPIPLLDGGHLAFYALEFVRGRPLSEKTQSRLLRIGMAMLISLMVFVTFNDIVHIL